MRRHPVALVLGVTLTTLVVVAATAWGSRLSVPPPNLAKVVPANYRVQHVWHERLTGQSTPEVIVSSVGPLDGQTGFHPADLQVLTWDSLAVRWDLTFDAEKARVYYGDAPLTNNQPPGPITASGHPSLLLDPKGEDHIGQVAVVRFGHHRLGNLVFTAFVGYGGSGQTASLIVLGFQQGQASMIYEWVGEDGIGFRPKRGSSGGELLATAPYWTLGDAHCCALRSYNFTIGLKNGYLTSLSDDRPWVGLYAVPTISGLNSTPAKLRVVGIVPHSPAASAFHVGDIIIAVEGVPRQTPGLGPAIVDEIEALNAGRRVSIRRDRGGRTLTVTVRLGSIIDPSALNAQPPSTFSILEI